MNNEQFAAKNVLPWHISWLTVVFAILTIGTFIAISGPDVRYANPMGTVLPTSVGGPMMDVSVSNAGTVSGGPSRGMMDTKTYYPYPYQNPDVPVTDTREFLKIYYNASLYTRDVPSLTRRVETTVRGYSGRIDQESVSPKYGSVSFSVPQSRYDAFRTELEGLVGSRFLSVNISSQNLLAQKVSIEEQQKQADTTLADYKTTRQKIVSAHTSAVQSLQAKIDADARQLTALRAEPSTPQLLIQIQTLSDEWTSLKQQLVRENASYATQLTNADANIKYAQDWQKAVQTQDKTLLDNVATVTGTVSVEWISLWDTVLLYLPDYWIPTIFALLTALSYLRDRRRTTVRLV
jgi:hypothetical protein